MACTCICDTDTLCSRDASACRVFSPQKILGILFTLIVNAAELFTDSSAISICHAFAIDFGRCMRPCIDGVIYRIYESASFVSLPFYLNFSYCDSSLKWKTESLIELNNQKSRKEQTIFSNIKSFATTKKNINIFRFHSFSPLFQVIGLSRAHGPHAKSLYNANTFELPIFRIRWCLKAFSHSYLMRDLVKVGKSKRQKPSSHISSHLCV